ncbi:MAG TPA: FlgD immunoglobulin-like domain containing protein [Candidatus Eisenbacteria bacterium]|nr:FlgD immunoglobulin-like domain containing protein [Candidatus Eisenbacteria bacterium]
MRRRAIAPLLAVAVPFFASHAFATPVPGLVESWPDSGSTDGWAGGAVYANPGHDGAGGPADGFLEISLGGPGNLGTRSSSLSAYSGDWVAAGITQVQSCLNDVGNADPLEIHFSLGATGNRWQYNPGFVPPLHGWAIFTVNLTDSTQWTQTIVPFGGGTFSAALRHVDVVNVRHDRPPFVQNPDDLAGDFGLDELVLYATTGITPHPATGGHPVLLRAPWPNPARSPLALSFTTFDNGPVRVRVVDAIGLLVRSADLGTMTPGERAWTWDGLDDRGRRVQAGVYRVQVTGVSGGTSQPVVLWR